MICRQGDSQNLALFSRDCNAIATGSCIQRNGELSLRPFSSTFDLYWRYCKNHNKYIVRDTIHIYRLTNTSIWIGLRKYKITNSNVDKDSCYIIEMRFGTVNYNIRNCTERHFSFCKREIGQIYFPNIQYINKADDNQDHFFLWEPANQRQYSKLFLFNY